MISTASDSESRWLTPPPARTAAFSQRAQAGQRLAGVADRGPCRAPHRTYWRVSVATPEQVAQEVERGALAGEDRPQRARRPRRAPSRPRSRRRRRRASSTSTSGRAARNASVAAAVPASTPRCAATNAADRGLVVADARERREVAERAEVLGERAATTSRDDATRADRTRSCGSHGQRRERHEVGASTSR